MVVFLLACGHGKWYKSVDSTTDDVKHSVAGFNACTYISCVNSSSPLLQKEMILSPVLPPPSLCYVMLHITVFHIYSEKELHWQANKESFGPAEQCGGGVLLYVALEDYPHGLQSIFIALEREMDLSSRLPYLANGKKENNSYLLWSIKCVSICTYTHTYIHI